MDVAAQVNELDLLLERVGKQGFIFHAFRTDRHGPEVLAAVHDWGGCADVVVLAGEDHALAYRVPTGPGVDVFSPLRVYWWYGHTAVWTLRAVLTLAPPGHLDAPNGLTDALPGCGIPAERRMPVRVPKR